MDMNGPAVSSPVDHPRRGWAESCLDKSLDHVSCNGRWIDRDNATPPPSGLQGQARRAAVGRSERPGVEPVAAGRQCDRCAVRVRGDADAAAVRALRGDGREGDRRPDVDDEAGPGRVEPDLRARVARNRVGDVEPAAGASSRPPGPGWGRRCRAGAPSGRRRSPTGTLPSPAQPRRRRAAWPSTCRSGTGSRRPARSSRCRRPVRRGRPIGGRSWRSTRASSDLSVAATEMTFGKSYDAGRSASASLSLPSLPAAATNSEPCCVRDRDRVARAPASSRRRPTSCSCTSAPFCGGVQHRADASAVDPEPCAFEELERP